MKITDIKIVLLHSGPVRALAEIVLDGGIAVKELRIVENKSGRQVVVWPVSQHTVFNTRYIVNPINDETRRNIEQQIFAAYSEEKAKVLKSGILLQQSSDDLK